MSGLIKRHGDIYSSILNSYQWIAFVINQPFTQSSLTQSSLPFHDQKQPKEKEKRERERERQSLSISIWYYNYSEHIYPLPLPLPLPFTLFQPLSFSITCPLLHLSYPHSHLHAHTPKTPQTTSFPRLLNATNSTLTRRKGG
jgi:hypothetical protein